MSERYHLCTVCSGPIEHRERTIVDIGSALFDDTLDGHGAYIRGSTRYVLCTVCRDALDDILTGWMRNHAPTSECDGCA